MTDPIKLILQVIKENTPNSKWIDSPLEAFRSVANTNRGNIGELFVERYLGAQGCDVARADTRVKEWDLIIRDKKVEVKTASEDSSGSFQFNHVRLDRKYDFLLCLGVQPNAIKAEVWAKGHVADGRAGTLVRMAEGQSVTFKLTKKPSDLFPIECLVSRLNMRID